ncbi:MAG TPA: DMT family transporter [Pseudoxanthomonas sp.]|nr:DMT family transporter [Pseudoxanthomonas sp.]
MKAQDADAANAAMRECETATAVLDPEAAPNQARESSATSTRLPLSGFALAALGAIAFSGKAIIVKLGYRYGVDAITLLALRMLVAFPFFLLMGLWASRRATPLMRGDVPKILGLGFFGYYLASFLDFAGLAYITATLERLILYLTPTLVLLINLWVFGKRASRLQWSALLISYIGVLLAFGHDWQLGGANIAVGGALVFGSALAYAIYLVGSGEMVRRVGAVRLTAYASSVASVLCIGQFLLLRPAYTLASLPQEVWSLSLLNGTLCTVLPVLMVMMAVSRIGSALAAQIGMLGPVSTIILSLFLLGEPMGPWQVLGTVLVMVGVFVVSRQRAA